MVVTHTLVTHHRSECFPPPLGLEEDAMTFSGLISSCSVCEQWALAFAPVDHVQMHRLLRALVKGVARLIAYVLLPPRQWN